MHYERGTSAVREGLMQYKWGTSAVRINKVLLHFKRGLMQYEG